MHLFANVGFSPQYIIPSIRNRPQLESVYLFYDKVPESKKAAKDIATVADALGIKVHHVVIETVFDAKAAFRTYLDTYRSLPIPRSVAFNTAGGPGVMVSVATAFAMIMNIPLFHVRRDNMQEEEFPTAAVWLRHGWSPKHREVLQAVFDGNRTQSSIAKATKLSTGYVSKILTTLENGGFIKAGVERRERVVSFAPLTQLIFEADEFHRSESEEWASNLRNYFAHMPDADPGIMRRRIEEDLRTLGSTWVEFERSQMHGDLIVETPAGRVIVEIKHHHVDKDLAKVGKRKVAPDWRQQVRQAVDRHLDSLATEIEAPQAHGTARSTFTTAPSARPGRHAPVR